MKDTGQKVILLELKARYDLTWQEVADALGVAKPTVESWLTGHHPMSRGPKILVRIFLDFPQTLKSPSLTENKKNK